MPQIQGWSVAGKAWTAFGGTLLASLLPIVGQVAGVLPAPYGALLTGIGGLIALITGRVAYSAPYQPVPSPGSPPQGGTPWPTS
jgi:hypothetical protein